MVNEGQTVPIGTAIAQIGAEGEAPADAAPAGGGAQGRGRARAGNRGSRRGPLAEPVPPALRPRQLTEAEAAPAAPVRADGEKLRASPLVKRLAAEHDIDLSGISGTGPGGRIVKDDLAPYLTGARPKPTAAPAPAARCTGPGCGVPKEGRARQAWPASRAASARPLPSGWSRRRRSSPTSMWCPRSI